MDGTFIHSIFQPAMNENVNVKIIRDRHSGYGSPHSQRSQHFISVLPCHGFCPYHLVLLSLVLFIVL